jgi:phosphoesterase RecJ-like protein
MSLTQTEQIKKLVEDSKHILLTFKKQANGDAIGSALAFAQFLKQIGKRTDIVCDDFVLPPSYVFLKESISIEPKLGSIQQFVITLDIPKNGLSELSYDMKDDKLRIFITPKHGYITKEQIKTAQTNFTYDLVIVFDTLDFESLGSVYKDHMDFFYQTPTINIDHKPANEQYGQINLVKLTASTTAEIVYELLLEMKGECITKDIATALLTGIIAGTNSFKKETVRPHTLGVASKLVDLGADRAFIVKNLYQTKSIATFKLWGAALTNLQHDNKHGLIWTTLTREDFARSGAKKEDLPGIIDELIASSPDAKFILLLHEHANEKNEFEIQGILKLSPAYHATDMMKKFNAEGDHEQTQFSIKGKTLKEAEQEVVEHLRQQINT